MKTCVQLNWCPDAFILDEEGLVHVLTESPAEVGEVMSTQLINNLLPTQLSAQLYANKQDNPASLYD